MPATKKKDTPAARVKARREPAVALPPRMPAGDRRSALRNLEIWIAGRAYLIGPSVEGDPTMSAAYDATATITVLVRDADGKLQAALGDEAALLERGVRMTVNAVDYMLQSANVDADTGTLVTLVFEDAVSWRLKQFDSYLAIRRSKKNTRFRAALRLVREASRAPLARMKYFIPELNDLQRIAAPAATSRTTSRGTGAKTGYRVKKVRATAAQRTSIDAVLTEADKEGASRRVMIAAIMTGTQESSLLPSATNGIHVGIFQQDNAYGSVAKRRDATQAGRGFLREWKRVHGSVKRAPGSLAGAIEAVQRSGQGSLYAQWETEATATVDAWLGGGGRRVTTTTKTEPYEFARGDKHGQAENSWDATGRWGSDVHIRRWAEGNVFNFVSDDELRASAPALEVNGDESWLLSPPGFDWSPDRPVVECTMRVLAERWGVSVGASVVVATGSPVDGRLIVAATEGTMVGPELTVTLRRPATKKPEPANDTQTSSSSSGSSGSAATLYDACEKISKQNRSYLYGGGHKALGAISAHESLDCSSSCSLALWMAGMFPGKVAITSGVFARSWGKAGRGHDFTVWANDGHVWIEAYDDSGKFAWRFDTSPHGSGPLGPHVRRVARTDQSRFTARHWAR